MARISKICHTPQCGGTKQPIALMMHPEGLQVRYVATCQTCGTDHPPDSDEIVTDAKTWEARVRAAHNGTIPLPLPTLQE